MINVKTFTEEDYKIIAKIIEEQHQEVEKELQMIEEAKKVSAETMQREITR
jgi:hypothetical protein